MNIYTSSFTLNSVKLVPVLERFDCKSSWKDYCLAQFSNVENVFVTLKRYYTLRFG